MLALLKFGASGRRAWKGVDAEALVRLHQSGFITGLRTKSTSIEFTMDGLTRADRETAVLFGKAG